MADDDTTASPPDTGDEPTLADLQNALQEKQEELAGLRAAREQEQIRSVEKVRKAQLADEIAKVQREIDNETAMLDNQQNLDVDLIATGTQPTGEQPGTENAVDPADDVVGSSDDAEAPPVPETPATDTNEEVATEEVGNETLEFGAIPGYVAPEGSDH